MVSCFMCQLGRSQYPDIWSNISLDIVVKVFFRRDENLNQQTLSKADDLPQ